jgi:hypothetical protein
MDSVEILQEKINQNNEKIKQLKTLRLIIYYILRKRLLNIN